MSWTRSSALNLGRSINLWRQLGAHHGAGQMLEAEAEVDAFWAKYDGIVERRIGKRLIFSAELRLSLKMAEVKDGEEKWTRESSFSNTLNNNPPSSTLVHQSTAAGVKPWALRIGLFNGQWLNRTDVAKGVSGFLFLCAGPFQCAGYANGKVTLVNPEVTQPELEKEFFIKLKPSILIKYSSYQTLTAKLLRKETYAYLKLFFNLVNVAKLQTEVHDLKEETDEDYILLVLEYTKEKFMVNNEYDEGNAKEVMRQWRPRQNDPRI
ncbi:hypothetical protein J3R30DRAFT_3679239 [Lentinula aciculospora]|uniref:Uncharacterized protein n=1 Tax=Lentinula aciculospora TaxID=153920 RepID=A0A9W9ASD5_9AGAR|nr:hypothetical protein J3R30DRAFT_3679239 [Lentinula aciculospora]